MTRLGRACALAAALLASLVATADAATIRTLGSSIMAMQDGNWVSKIGNIKVLTGDLQWSCPAGPPSCTLSLDASVFKVTGTLDEPELANASVAFLNDSDGISDSNTCTGSGLTATNACLDISNTATSSSTSAIDRYAGRFLASGTWGSGANPRSCGVVVGSSGAPTGQNFGVCSTNAPMMQDPGTGTTLDAVDVSTNRSMATSTTNLIPGLDHWHVAGFGAYGHRMVYESTLANYRAMSYGFIGACLGYTGGTVPTGNSGFAGVVCTTNNTNVHFLTTASTRYSLVINGQSARSIGMARNTTSNTAGNSLTYAGGAAALGATDKDSGGIFLDPDVSTGTGRSFVRTYGYTMATSTGTSDNTPYEGRHDLVPKTLTDNVAASLESFTLASNTSVGVSINYSVEAKDGSNHVQNETGWVTCNVINSNGTFLQGGTNGCSAKYGNQQAVTASGGGTLTVTWTLSGANPSVLQITADTSLTASTGYPRVTYTMTNLTRQAVAVQ